MNDRRHAHWRMVAGISCIALALGGGAEACAAAEPGEKPGLPQLYQIAPGTAVEGKLPKGWTHRIVRSQPRLASGDLESLPDSARATATLVRTTVLADVERRGGSYELERVGVGNAVPVGDRELVVTLDGPQEAWDQLGVVDRVVVRVAQGKLDEGRLIARTPTFALLRTPSVMTIGGKHEDVDLHYAMLVDPKTGGIATLSWATPVGSGAIPDRVVALPPDPIFDVALDVRTTRALGPVPLAWSFAMNALPPGQPIQVPNATARLIAGAGTDEVPPAALERALKALIK